MNRFTNKVLNMDNLELMRIIPDNSIDLIYCDILYGTGRDFGDYQDIDSNRSRVEEFYIPRIQEMHRILKTSGSIYLQMDYRIEHWIRIIMDNIFGANNFQNQIIWSYRTGGTTKKRWNRKHDNILFYTKTSNYNFNSIKEKTYVNDSFGNANVNTASSRRLGLQRDGGGVYRYVLPRDVWDINAVYRNDKQRVDYYSQKPKKLLEKIILASSNEGDIVADFFCGSGTAPVVAKQLGRKYIACDIESKAVNITRNRLSEVG